MHYSHEFIAEPEVPRARQPMLQHLVDTYASETNKLGAVWSELRDDQLDFRMHPRSSSIRQILRHQMLSEACVIALARSRLAALAAGDEQFWLAEVPFFDVRRQRIWIFWRRVLHTAHHRAQIGDCLRLLNARVPPTYGPTADVTWSGADPTQTLDAVRRAQR